MHQQGYVAAYFLDGMYLDAVASHHYAGEYIGAENYPYGVPPHPDSARYYPVWLVLADEEKLGREYIERLKVDERERRIFISELLLIGRKMLSDGVLLACKSLLREKELAVG